MKNVILLALLCIYSITGYSLSASDEVLIADGYHSVLEMSGGKTYIVNGTNVVVGNFNMNGTATLIIPAGKKLTLNGALNLNGNVSVYNYGVLKIQNLELQNGNNYIQNEGEFIAAEGQINDNTSRIRNCGTMSFSENLNLHSQVKEGAVYICDCALLTTNGLNLNGKNAFDGGGGLVVTGNLNLNNYLGTNIYFVYSGNINNASYIKDVEKVSEYFRCERTLPVVYSSVVVNKQLVSFEVTAPEQIEKFIIQTSRDGKSWKNEKEIPVTGNGAGFQTKYTYQK